MMSHDTDDMIEKRKRRHKLRTLRNLLIFLLIAGFCGYLYVQRDMWIPKLEGIGSRYDSVTQNDGTLAEGNFPLTISGSTGYEAQLVDDTLFLLPETSASTPFRMLHSFPTGNMRCCMSAAALPSGWIRKAKMSIAKRWTMILLQPQSAQTAMLHW